LIEQGNTLRAAFFNAELQRRPTSSFIEQGNTYREELRNGLFDIAAVTAWAGFEEKHRPRRFCFRRVAAIADIKRRARLGFDAETRRHRERLRNVASRVPAAGVLRRV
jgi:hypothetical protein